MLDLHPGRFGKLNAAIRFLMFLSLLFSLDHFACAEESKLLFERDIRAIFRAHCLDCHGATDEKEGGLDLRLTRFLQQGGDSGPAIVPGKPLESLLVERVRNGEMPPGEGKLSAEEIQKIADWVAAGAPTARPEPETLAPGVPILPEERDWWSFQPVVKQTIPQFPAEARIRTPVDAFLLKAMPDGLTFSPDADRLTQLLRVSFDLIGLPPTPEKIQQFLSDDSPAAYERAVDELLESPHYGERWGRHWLDVAGYADSEGRTNQDAVRDWSYKYRDYVIRAFNINKPFDRFLHEQLAGDELAGPIKGDLTAEQIDLLTATGYLRMAADGTGSGDNSEEARNLVMADTLQIVSTSLLGLSVACAQCHDHRYDPISHTDYFAMRAVFEPALDWKHWKTPAQRRVSLYTQNDREAAARIEAEAQVILKERTEKQSRYMEEAFAKELENYEEPLREQINVAYHTPDKERTPEQKALLKKNPRANITPGVLYQYNQAAADDLKKDLERAEEIRARKPHEEFIRALTESTGAAPETHLLHRGDHRQPKQVVQPAAMTVLCAEDQFVSFSPKDESLPTTGRRLAFARWLTSPGNPITARVLVNRIWLHHFGHGLVDTPADFGKMGAKPTHPELLDWLATELMESGWNLKQMHRTMVLSTAYRQSSRLDPRKSAIDEINQYYWRRNITRLDAEVLRDRVLATTGTLDLTQFGPAVPVKEDSDGMAKIDSPVERRSLYLQQRRSLPISMLQAFDAPVMAVNCERRPSSTVATQSLMLMNSPFALEHALRLAERVMQSNSEFLTTEQTAALPAILPPPAPLWQYGFGGYEEATETATDKTNQTDNAPATGVVKFTPLTQFDKQRWQAGPAVPDPKTGWVFLNATGGHTGTSPEYAPIRRWTAPAAGTINITGTLEHASPNGDGVRGRVVTARGGRLGEWVAQHGKEKMSLKSISVAAGETVDFITDCRQNVNSDSFSWVVTIQFDMPGQTPINMNSQAAFTGPSHVSTQLTAQQIAHAWLLAYCRLPTPEDLELTIHFLNRQITEMQLHSRELPAGTTISQQALANFCQALLTSNEFLYVE